MNTIARIISRGKQTTGLIIPLQNTGLPQGIFDIQEMDGVYILQYRGLSALQESNKKKADNSTCNDLFNQKPHSLMTQKELNSTSN